MFHVIYQTRETVSSGYPNSEKREENTTRSGVFFTEFDNSGCLDSR